MKKKVIGVVLILSALLCLYFIPDYKPETAPVETPEAAVDFKKEVISEIPEKPADEIKAEPETASFSVKEKEEEIKEVTEEQKEAKSDFVSLARMYDNVNPENTEDIPITDKEHTCTLSVRCDTILSNMGRYGESKGKSIPANGIIYPEKQVVFYEGESVFNLLLREMKINGIHFEFVNTPIYKTAYIEGINNIYEFDFGELSGWMYKVNGVFLRYGCSTHLLKEGDRVEWVYTCDLGKDVGDLRFEGI